VLEVPVAVQYWAFVLFLSFFLSFFLHNSGPFFELIFLFPFSRRTVKRLHRLLSTGQRFITIVVVNNNVVVVVVGFCLSDRVPGLRCVKQS